MEVYLIRHTTPLLTPGLIYGHLDVGLADDFSEEFQKVKSQMPVRADVVYASPSTRCTLLANELSGHVRTDARLRELHFGEWEGKTWDTVDQAALQFWMDDYVNVCPPGGESMRDLEQRVLSFWEEFSHMSMQNACIVTHAGVIRMLLTFHHKLPLSDFFKIHVAYGEVVRLTV